MSAEHNEFSAEQYSRAGPWVLAAQLIVILPLYKVLPVWTILLWGSVAFWYWKVLRSAWVHPSALIKTALVLAGFSGIYFSYGRFLAIEPMVAVLVIALVLKLLELKHRRDYWLVLFLCYFCLGCGFLFEQGLLSLAVAIVQLLVLLAAQQRFYGGQLAPTASLKLAGLMLLQAVPLMLFLFVVFPRIGPLWTMPLPSQSARTGMSDNVEFGDISSLIASADLAFRVQFEGEPPAAEQRYWRGLVLENLQGRRWSRSDYKGLVALPESIKEGGSEPDLSYTITLESNFHEWLYSLTPSVLQDTDAHYAGAGQWLLRKPRNGRLQYQGQWFADVQIDAHKHELTRNLQLPDDINPRTRALAEQWRLQYSQPSERLAAALAYFRSGQFIYTLQPPRLGKDNVDEFLFETRQGFCEHFAGSLVFALRAAGVPARLVVGYQGGEMDAEQGYFRVYQSDAHAWAEVWLEGQGWLRVDPTATVSPDRIRLGAESVFGGVQGFLDAAPLSLRNFAWAAEIRAMADRINYAWARWVVNFDSDSQSAVLVKLLGKIDMQRLLIALLLFGGLPLLLLGIWATRFERGAQLPKLEQRYLACCQQLAKLSGIGRREGETPHQYLQRIQAQAPEWGVWFAEVTEVYVAARYRPGGDNNKALLQMKTLAKARRI
ncbi:DUF3488 domain-containing transglutaminase family protein [Spongiibacter sp. KMU-158]|uniref:DUF3488 domain-containing transglutaminase family protein n=1 Tax=Spongiibacter pelagi TaxID=2760804 RepID=A0A927C3Q9_9GAMM|nr:DUF3488 and transglutaminase-like domain-containing protein [Spongiibacter pelagi]MBD2859061.1 DUF3488 domain-containing transglutaminase family protein [Spongiibacter pelagi]